MNLKEETLTNLIALPESIIKKELKIMEIDKRLEESKLMLSSSKISVMNKIEAENIEAKEKKESIPFSNSEKRDLECKKRMEENYPSINETIISKSNELKTERIELDFLKRRFRAYESISRIGVD